MATIRTAVCVLLVSFLVAGCGRKKEEVKVDWPEDPEVAEARRELANVNPDVADEGATLSAGDYGAKVPPHFPKDVMLPEALIVKGAREMNERFMMNFTATCEVREIADAFVKNLQDKGWKLDSKEISRQEAFISGGKDDRMITVVITRDGMGCAVELDVARPTGEETDEDTGEETEEK